MSSAPAQPPVQPATPGSGASRGPQQQQDKPDWRYTLLRSLLMYFAFQAVVGPNGLIKWYQGKAQDKTQQAQPIEAQQAGMDNAAFREAQQANARGTLQMSQVSRVPKGTMSSSYYPTGTTFDFYLWVTASGSPTADDLATQYSTLLYDGKGAQKAFQLSAEDVAALQRKDVSPESMLDAVYWSPRARLSSSGALTGMQWTNITLDNWNLQRDADLSIAVPENVRNNNGSLWAEMLLAPTGTDPLTEVKVMRCRKLLTRLYPARRERQEKKLFGASGELENEKAASPSIEAAGSVLPFLDRQPAKIVPYWHGNLTLALVDQPAGSQFPISQLPPPMAQYIHVVEDNEGQVHLEGPTGLLARNLPVVFPNDFWHLREHMFPVNSTTEMLSLHVNLYMTSFWKYQLISSMSDSFEKQPGMAASEVDTIKLTLLDNSPWYLGLTLGVGLLHSLFEFLAFSSDVSHWRKKKDMIGVSLGSILTNIFVQLVILLYLLDQRQDTSWMILGSQAVGIVIEAWKVTKAVTVALVPRKRGEGKKWLQWLPYRLDVKDKHVLSEEEKRTQEYDKLAFTIVSYLAIPLLGAYTAYSAIYQTHKGWWSFIISTLCSFVYAFGFVSLIPQLIVNYKLKSTAGMNSKTFVYKILGTVVDDFAAFAIRQPMLHRLACFRDDVVFLVYLYQRWIYGVDPTRVNEFGQVLEEKTESTADKPKLESKKDQ